MDHRKCLGLNVTFDDTKNKAMGCFNYLKEKETGPMPDFVASTGCFISSRRNMAFIASSAQERSSPDAASSYPHHLKAIVEECGGLQAPAGLQHG